MNTGKIENERISTDAKRTQIKMNTGKFENKWISTDDVYTLCIT